MLNNIFEKFAEMSNIYQDETELPVNIWIDAAKVYKKDRCSKHIKFQANDCGNIGGQPVCPMMLNGQVSPEIIKKKSIDLRYINAVRNFVLNNQFALEKAADELIRDSEFKLIMIKSGTPASEDEKKELIHKTKTIIKSRLNTNIFSDSDKKLAEKALMEFPEIPDE